MDDAGRDAGRPLLWMPGLFGTGRRPAALEAALPGIRRLWPGLPARLAAAPEAGAAAPWTPPGLPFSPAEMGAFVAELERFAADGARGGQGVREAVLARAREERALREAEEIRAVRALGGTPGEREEGRLRAARRAQRLLAWFWFGQRVLADVDALVSRINEGFESLGTGLSDGAGPEVPVPPLGGALGGAEGAPASSEIALLEAAAELAPGAVFVLEGPSEALADAAGWRDDAPFAAGLVPPAGMRVRGAEIVPGASGGAGIPVLLLGEDA